MMITGRNLVILLHSASKLQLQHQPMLSALCARLKPLVHLVPAGRLHLVAGACAALGHQDHEMFDLLSQRAVVVLHDMSGNEVAQLLGSFNQLGYPCRWVPGLAGDACAGAAAGLVVLP
jgi:hypothetical protein